MKKGKTVRGKVVACAFVLLAVLAMFAGVVPVAAATTWYVDDSGGADFMSIQDAVDAANDGDTIIVKQGTYIENVKVSTDHLTIKSENGADSTIVQAANTNDHVFWITTDYVNISGFTAKGATGTYKKAGFYLRYGDHCNISSNTANENDLGIYLYGSYGNIISDNTVNNNDCGINVVYNSNNNAISGNTANENICGILLSNSTDNTVSDNTANNNTNYGIELYCSDDNTVSGNTVNENIDHGIRLHYSNGNTVSDNTVNNNDYSGIYLWLSNGNTVSGNTVNENYYHGIYLLYSDGNTVSSNTANNNGYRGIYLLYSDNNIIILNNFINNGYNAHTYSSTNIWNSTAKITYTYKGNTYTNYLGNYWDDYTNVDADNDGIWDNPYSIDGDEDFYPLKERFENYIEQPPYLNGKIVFHTNRDNNFEIYIMGADGTNQTRLTRNAGNDHYAVWSPDGAKIAFTSEKDGNEEIYVMNPNGTNQNRLTYNSASDWVPDFSPDGKKIAFTSNRDGNSEVYIMNSEGGDQTRLTENNADDRDPEWSITNKIAFESNRDGNPEIYLMDADGNNVIRLTHNSAVDRHPAWYSDGSKIVFTTDRDGNDEIYVMNADGSNQMRITYNSASDLDPAWSPDENYFVFATNRTGNYEIYRMDTDGSNQTRLTVNTNEDYRPDWGLPALTHNHPPNPPTNLAQFKSDSTTEIPVGGTTDERTVSFKGTVSDPDGDMVKLQVELRRLDEYGGQFDETKGGLKDSGFVASGSEAVAYAEELIDADYHWRARAVDEHGDSSAWQEFGGNDVSEADFLVLHTYPSGTINVILLGYVDDATLHWTYRTNYNAPVFRRGVDNPLFMLTLDGQIPSNYEYLFEIYSPNGASPIGSKRSSSVCCWDWTDINGNPLNKDQIPIGIYTVNGYLVNRNNPEDRKIIGFDEFYVIFDFDRSKESFVCWTQDYSYCKGCPNFEFNLNNAKIWKRAVDNASGSVTVIEAVGKISNFARNIDGNMVYHHPETDDETSVFGSDGYDNDFDGEIDEGWLIFKEENWDRDYMCKDGGKAYYESWESWEWKVWHKIYYPVKSAIWIDDKGIEFDNPKTAAKIAHYYDNMEMIKRDFDPENRIPRQHSLGVCDDYAMLTVGYLRAIGVPSRPVIGVGKVGTENFTHEWLQWYENGKWHHLDTDNIAHKTTWNGSKYNALYYHSEQSVIFDYVGVRRDDMLPNVNEDPSNIADEYNGHAAAHTLTTSESSDNKTVCDYEIINTPIFEPGENSTVKLNITNSANESKTVIVVVVLIPYLGPYRTPSLSYAESDKEITIAANSTVTEDFNLEVVGFTSPGDYNLTVYEVVNNNATLALTTATEVSAKYTITAEMPDNITYKQPFTFNVTLKNIVTAPIHNISVELDTHYHFNTTEPWEKEILTLDAGENYTFTWSLTPIDYGDLRVDVIVYTSDAGSETKITYISVLQTPKLWINAQVPEKVNKSDDFILNATIFNSGDIPSDNVTLNLTIPENVTANEQCAELGIIEAHENKTCSFRISQNESRDFMIILNATALDVTATGYAFITISQLPISYFTYEPQNPVVTQLITFNASNSTDPDGIITEYEWHFGDGNVTNTTEPIITHSYASTGDYTVNLTVTDDDGATNSTSKIITVTNLCGDVAPCPDCDGTVDMGDVILLLNNVSYPENPRYTLCNDWSGDCRCTGVRDMGDVILLLNNVSYPEASKYALDCC